MKNLISKIRWKFVPSEFKTGSWLFVDGNGINVNDLWRKSTKKGMWFIPRIELRFYEP